MTSYKKNILTCVEDLIQVYVLIWAEITYKAGRKQKLQDEGHFNFFWILQGLHLFPTLKLILKTLKNKRQTLKSMCTLFLIDNTVFFSKPLHQIQTHLQYMKVTSYQFWFSVEKLFTFIYIFISMSDVLQLFRYL